MIKNFFNSHNNIEIEIEKPCDQEKTNTSNINPHELIRNYKDIKILSINPLHKQSLERLTQEIRHDIQHLKRIIGNF
jgi:hypothetical protein